MKTYIVTTKEENIIAGIFTTENDKKAMYEAFTGWELTLGVTFIEFVTSHRVQRLKSLDGLNVNIHGLDMPEEAFDDYDEFDGGRLNVDKLKEHIKERKKEGYYNEQ